MPRSDEQPDYIHTFTNDGEGKSKTTRIAPIEIGRDNAPLTRVTMDELDESKVRNATTGTRILHMDPAGELRVKDPNGNSREVRGADSLQTLVGSPVKIGGTANLEVSRGQDIQDDTGTTRLAVQSDRTTLRNEGGVAGVSLQDGNGTFLLARSGEPVQVTDSQGSFEALKYTSSASSPGTLELGNAQLKALASPNNQRAIVLGARNDTLSKSLAFENGNGEVVTLRNNEGELEASDSAGNTTTIT